MATYSSVLAWRIPGTGEPGGLLSVGLHRVRHDWSDLAAAVAAHRFNLPWICNEVFTKTQRTRFKELLGWWTQEAWGLAVLWESTGAPWPLSCTLPCGCGSDPESCPTLCHPMDCSTPLSSTISQSLLRFTPTESVILSNHLILHHPFSFCLQSFPGSGPFPISRLLHSRCLLPWRLRWERVCLQCRRCRFDP